MNCEKHDGINPKALCSIKIDETIRDLIQADKEFLNGLGVRFSSLEELDEYLERE